LNAEIAEVRQEEHHFFSVTGREKSKRQKSYIVPDSVLPPRLSGLVRVAGRPIQFEIECDVDETRIEHVWLDIEAGDEGLFRIALNTCHAVALPRDLIRVFGLRLLLLHGTSCRHQVFSALMVSIIQQSRQKMAAGSSHIRRSALERLLIERFERAIFIQAWGELYERGHRGLHQVHSRRASAVVHTDYIGRGGAICLLRES
jgi:hypothetical protein